MANNVSVVDQIVKSLSFEVEAVPQEDAKKLTSTSNSTPLNVRIRVRKKQEYGMQQGYLSVPKFGRPDSIPERVRLISSDQTIMSFDVSMEADFVKKPKRKPRKLFFGGCLGTEYDDDEVPYTQNSTYNAKMTDANSSSKSDGIIRQKFTLSKTKYDNTNALQQYTKKNSILGRCKPGGCLDPPFSEEKYSYKPQIGKEKIASSIEDPVNTKAKNKFTKADDGHRTSKESKQPSKDSIIQKADHNSASILSIYDNSLKGSLDSKYSDSVITYPPLMSPSAVSNERNSRNRISSEEKPRRSYNDSIEAFYTSPKKSNRFNERNSSGADSTLKEKAKIVPIPVPIGIGPLEDDIISKSDKTRTRKLLVEDSMLPKEAVANETKKEKDKTNLLTQDDISTSNINDSHVTTPHIRDAMTPGEIDNNDTKDVKSNTVMVTPSGNGSTHMLDSIESSLTTPYARDIEPNENNTYDSDGTKRDKTDIVDSTSSNDSHLVKDTFFPNSNESNVFTPNQDLTALEETGSKMNNGAGKTIFPVILPIPLVDDNNVTKSDNLYSTMQHDKQFVSLKEPEEESDSAKITSDIKDIVSTNEPKLNQPDKRSTYSDNSVMRSKNTKYGDTTINEISNDEVICSDDPSNKAISAVPPSNFTKEAELILQSSPVGSLKNSIIDTLEYKNKKVSYSEPYAESTQTLKELQDLNDEATAMQDQHKNVSHGSKKYGDKEESKQNVKTEVYDSDDKNSAMTYNQTVDQNISKSGSKTSFTAKDKSIIRISTEQMNIDNKRFNADNIPEEYVQAQRLSSDKEIDKDSLEPLNKLKIPIETPSIIDDSEIKNNKTSDVVNGNSNEDAKRNQILSESNINDENKELDLQENKEDTFSNFDNKIASNKTDIYQDLEPTKFNTIIKPINEEYIKREIEKDENLTGGLQNGSDFVDPFTQSSNPGLIDKTVATTEHKQVSQSTKNNKDSILQKSSNHKSNSAGSNSKANADKGYYDTSEVSSKIYLKRDSIALNLGFQTYINERNEKSLKTIDVSSDSIRYPDDSVTVIQSHLRPEANEIRIPIDSDNDLTIKILRNKSPVETTEQEPFDYNKSGLAVAKRYGLPDIPHTKNNENNLQGFHENYTSEIPTMLNSVYEQELLPLQKTIDHLKKEIDILASQQSILIEKMVNVKRNKPVRLLRVNSRCACFR